MSQSKFMRAPDGRTRRKRGKGPRFVQLFWFVVDSPIWREMTGDEVKAYIRVARRFNGTNNGSIVISARELAVELGCSKSKAARLLKSLVDRGLLEIAVKSAFSLKTKRATEYRLTTYPCDLSNKPASWTAQALPQQIFSRSQSFGTLGLKTLALCDQK
jgi:DNA-binding transcriptional MocR family regulator